MSEVKVQILPPDEGARPWLREKAHVPVLWNGDPEKILGMAAVEASDGALVATIELTDFGLHRWLHAGEDHLRFGVHGKVVKEHTIDEVRIVDEIDITHLSAEES